jgi:formylglycine-generating enzyme required for sulfatase activity
MTVADRPDVVTIPEGAFLMGCEAGQENERPVHRVWLDRFALGKFPVTNRQYREFLESTGTEPPRFWLEPMFADPRKPVVGLTWFEAVAYCRWLELQTGESFRLPTEAEWERAARGGREGTLFPWGDDLPTEGKMIGCDAENGGPAPVGANPPNGFGLYDMSEGVHEWCSDYYEYNYYRDSPERNPQGAASGERRASRGGSWRHQIKFARCAARSSLPPSFEYSDYGFRVAVTIGN